MSHRIYCDVPGCTRYSRAETCLKRWGTTRVRLLCATHWKRLSRRERAVIRRMERIRKRYGDEAVARDRWLRAWDALFRRAADPRRIGRELGL
jgi:hypothetical protein